MFAIYSSIYNLYCVVPFVFVCFVCFCFCFLMKYFVGQLNDAKYCELQEIHTGNVIQCGLTMSKSGALQEYIEHVIAKTRESGLMDYISIKWSLPKIDCNLVRDLNTSIDFQHFAPALFFLIGGMLVAIVTLFLEFMIYKWQNRTMR